MGIRTKSVKPESSIKACVQNPMVYAMTRTPEHSKTNMLPQAAFILPATVETSETRLVSLSSSCFSGSFSKQEVE